MTVNIRKIGPTGRLDKRCRKSVEHHQPGHGHPVGHRLPGPFIQRDGSWVIFRKSRGFRNEQIVKFFSIESFHIIQTIKRYLNGNNLSQ